jgi:hypothetical protein
MPRNKVSLPSAWRNEIANEAWEIWLAENEAGLLASIRAVTPKRTGALARSIHIERRGTAKRKAVIVADALSPGRRSRTGKFASYGKAVNDGRREVLSMKSNRAGILAWPEWPGGKMIFSKRSRGTSEGQGATPFLRKGIEAYGLRMKS